LIKLTKGKEMKKSKIQLKREAIKAWWDREPWPAIILAVDPGRKAGASIVRSLPYHGITLLASENVDTYSRNVERLIRYAVEMSIKDNLYLFVVLESWGKGGLLGIDQWIGLGEARGVWKREFIVTCSEVSNTIYIRKKNVFTVTQNRWRSRVVPETGIRDEKNKFHRFTPGQWKEAAHRAALDYFPSDWVPELDASESACMAVYAARSDEIGSRLPKTHLNKYSLEYSSLENLI
jgi:hypothetical protein